MTRFRSMTDKQMLAKYGYDKEPWIGPLRDHHAHNGTEIGLAGCTFAPRPECIPSPDPMPWAGALGNYRTTVRTSAYMSFKPRPWGTFTPDPEFVRSGVNPILAYIREDVAERQTMNNPVWDTTLEQIVHARKVLTKLHNVLEAGK